MTKLLAKQTTDVVQNILERLSLTPISKTPDLIGCTPMRVRKLKGQGEDVLKLIVASMDKAIIGLGFEIAPERVVLLASDTIEAYGTDSVEDVLHALKLGRQNQLEFPEFASRNRFNMEIVSHWMSQVLDKKAQARESLLTKYKFNDKEPIEKVDYEAYKERAKEDKNARGTMGRHAHREYVRGQAQTQMKNNSNLKTKNDEK